MKYRYQVMINVVILALATSCIIYFIKIDNEINYFPVHYCINDILHEIDNQYEELIMFCDKNQEEIGVISEEFLSIREVYMTYKVHIKMENRITNSNWIKISQTLQFNEVRPGLVQYYYDSIRWSVPYDNGSHYEYICTVFYMVENEEEIERFLSCRYQKYQYQKINDHLYVCLDRQQMV